MNLEHKIKSQSMNFENIETKLNRLGFLSEIKKSLAGKIIAYGLSGLLTFGCSSLIGCGSSVGKGDVDINYNTKNQVTCIDNDHDGYGVLGTDLSLCSASNSLGDCNDDDATINPGASEVCEDETDNDCSGTVDDVKPTAVAEAGYDQAVNEYDIVQFYGQNSTPGCPCNPIILYEWDFGDGTIVSGPDLTNPRHIYTCYGTYFVNLKVQDGISLGIDTTAVDVNDLDAVPSNCTQPPYICGNSTIESPEVCDGANLNGKTCSSLGYDSGNLGCVSDCFEFNTSSCSTICGDGVRKGLEQCDGSDLSGQSCIGLGYDFGSLSCQSDCTLDESGCENFVCGNNIIENSEKCDNTNLDGQTCSSLGYSGGALTCRSDCIDFDINSCISQCNDGIDNDGDTLEDLLDPGCVNGNDKNEINNTKLICDPIYNPAIRTGRIAFDGNSFYVGWGETIHAFNISDGSTIGSFPTPNSYYVSGLAWDGNNLLISTGRPFGLLCVEIYKVDASRALADGNTNNAIVSVLGCPPSPCVGGGIAFDGNNLWVASDQYLVPPTIFKTDPVTGGGLGNFELSPYFGKYIGGCSWGDDLICLDRDNDLAYVIDSTTALAEGNIENAVIRTYTLPDQIIGIAWENATSTSWYPGYEYIYPINDSCP